ncbi:YoaK family protein [Actinomadura scrupuli]|uniref:YoaK family protein n=1 Tax=Actinomadura scrupuli TaxID=559629 RepID=UPI003D975547
MNPLARRDPLLPALVSLTVLSGFVDAVSYLGLGHVFTANMTGNVVILGFAAAGAPGFSVTASSTSLGAFVVGAVIGGRSNTAAVSRRARILTALGAEAALLLVAAVTASVMDVAEPAGRHLVIAFVALAMGLRNATVRSLAVPDLPTTVLTRTITGLAADSTLAGGTNPRAARRAAAVLGMALGACLGALLLRHLGTAWPLLVTAVFVVVTATAYALHPGSRAYGDGRDTG